ncbi:MAG: DNA ligase D [Actinobacteria bacterium]|nr:DNA ligase D [Actinomycetota bacterium]
MLATPVKKPFDNAKWIFEIKWDGYRAISMIRNNSVSMYSRNDISFNEKFKPLVNSLERMQIGNALLDGEIVVLDESGKSEFQLLQNYIKTAKGNLVYHIFDLLFLDKFDLRRVRLEIRKQLLRELILDNEYIKSGIIKNIKFNGHVEKEGIVFYNAAVANNLEGIIAKNKESIYEPGIRSREWLKIKIRLAREFIICGYTIKGKTGSSAGSVSSLITGVFKDGRLVFTGLVGSGFTQRDRRELYLKLSEIETAQSPFTALNQKISHPHWVKPVYVAQVAFAQYTDEGIMRQPVYEGLRIDKSANEVISYRDDFKGGFKSANNNINGGFYKTSKVMIKNMKAKSEIILTNPEKIFWSKENITKKDLFDYYKKISPYIMPYIIDRLQSLNRCPDGIDGECFYQKDIDYKMPQHLRTEKIYSESRKEFIDYFLCTGLDSLLYMVNLGCIDIHPWISRIKSIEMPDYAIIDLDPLDVDFSAVLHVARHIKDFLDDIGCRSFYKTSGSKGLHIYIPLGAAYTYSQSLDFVKVLAGIINKQMPQITSLERHPDKRHGKVYLDCFQNKYGATVAAPYCIRPRPGATVSAPLKPEELYLNIKPQDFHMQNIFKRLELTGDLWEGFIKTSVDILACLSKIQKKYKLA